MSRKYNIRWTDADNQEIAKAVKNFNAKITRLEKKLGPQKENALPERVSAKALKELVTTRRDLKRELNALRRFSKRGAEELVQLPDNDYNTTITKWQRNEMSRLGAIRNQKRKERYKDVFDLPAMSGGKELGYTVGQQMEYIGMGKIAENELKPTPTFTPSMSRTGAHYRFKALKLETRDAYWHEKEERLRQAYIKGITENYNIKDVEDIISTIENMEFNEFYKKFLQDPSAGFEIASPDSKKLAQVYESNLNELRSAWLPNYKPMK